MDLQNPELLARLREGYRLGAASVADKEAPIPLEALDDPTKAGAFCAALFVDSLDFAWAWNRGWPLCERYLPHRGAEHEQEQEDLWDDELSTFMAGFKSGVVLAGRSLKMDPVDAKTAVAKLAHADSRMAGLGAAALGDFIDFISEPSPFVPRGQEDAPQPPRFYDVLRSILEKISLEGGADSARPAPKRRAL